MGVWERELKLQSQVILYNILYNITCASIQTDQRLHASFSALCDEEAWRYSQDWNKAGLWLVSFIVTLGFDRSMPLSHLQDIVILSVDVGTQLWNKTSTLHIDLSQEKVWERVYRPSIYSL